MLHTQIHIVVISLPFLTAGSHLHYSVFQSSSLPLALYLRICLAVQAMTLHFDISILLFWFWLNWRSKSCLWFSSGRLSWILTDCKSIGNILRTRDWLPSIETTKQQSKFINFCTQSRTYERQMNNDMNTSMASRRLAPGGTHGTPESEFSNFECFQNYTAPEVFVQGMAGIVNQVQFNASEMKIIIELSEIVF